MNEPRRVQALAATLVVVTIGLFVAWPASRIIDEGFQWRAWQELIGSPRIRSIVLFTMVQAALSVVCTMAIGLCGAWLLGTRRVRGSRWFAAAWSAPFTLPGIVMGAAMLAALPPRWERSLPAIVLAHTCFNAGMVARTLGDAWRESDQRFEEVASTLGCGPVRRTALLLRVLRPQIVAVTGLVTALCLTSFAIISILGGPRRGSIETEIHRQTFQLLRLDRAAALAILQLIVVGLVLSLSGRRRLSAAMVPRRRLRKVSWFISVPIISMLSFITVLPIFALMRTATRADDGHWTVAAFTRLTKTLPASGLLRPPLHSVQQSFTTAALATVLAVTLAVAATIAARRREQIATVALLPLAVSGVTVGLGMLLAFSRAPVDWRDDAWMVPVVQAIIAFPFAIRVLRPASATIDPRLREVAATLGDAPVRVLWRVDGALLLRAIGTAAGVAFAVALGEFGATTFLVRPRRETMPVVISMLAARPGATLRAASAAMAVVLALATGVVSIISALIIHPNRAVDAT